METVNKRLFEFLEHYKNLKQKEIQRIFKLRQNSNLSSWMNDKEDIPDKYVIFTIQKYPELNANWLINGTGEMLNRPSENNQVQSLWNPPLSLNDDNLVVKTYSCPDCIWRDKLIKSQDVTIASLEKLVNELQKKEHSGNDDCGMEESGRAI